MKNALTASVIVAILVVIGSIYFYSSRSLPTNSMKKETIMMKRSNRYIPYSKTVFEDASGKRRILYFYATWCPSCKITNEDFSARADKIPEDVMIIRVNYNDPDTDQEEKALAKQYGISYQHTFVQVDLDGNEITKWNGGGIDELLVNIK